MYRKMILNAIDTFSSKKNQLENNLCYMRQNGMTCFATKSPEIAREFVANMDIVSGIDLSRMLEETLRDYNFYVEQAYNGEEYVIQFKSSRGKWYVIFDSLALDDEDTRIESVATVIEKIDKLTKLLRNEAVAITYLENDKPYILYTSLAGYKIASWLHSTSKDEIQKVKDYFEKVEDVGELFLPDMCFPPHNYKRINILDIEDFEVVD